MKSKLKIISICVCAALVIIGGVLFGLYKIFVTPQRMVLLTLMDVPEDFEDSFEYLWEADNEVIKDFFKHGGNIQMDLTLSDAAILNDMPVSIEINKDKNCSVTEVGLYDKFDFSMYKDDSEVFINTPLFSGGFKIPVKSFNYDWNKSLFKDVVKVSPEYGAAQIAKDFALGHYNAENFIKSNGNEIIELVESIDVEKDGSSEVSVSGGTKKAGEYSMKVSKEQYDRFADILMSYIKNSQYGSELIEDIAKSRGITEEEAESYIRSGLDKYSYNRHIILKISNMKLREVVIMKEDGGRSTISFEGEKNAFDVIKYYTDDNIRDAVLRMKSRIGRDVTDSVSIGEGTIISLETKNSGFKIYFKLDDLNVNIKAEGKSGNDDLITFENFEFEIADVMKLKGNLKISDEYDKDFAFGKTGEYVDLLSIDQEEWDAVSSTLTDALNLMSDEK